MIPAVATVIIGAGEVGSTLAGMLTHEYMQVVLVDKDEQRLARASETMDVQTVVGFGAAPAILDQAGVSEADLLIAVTDVDEVNMISALTAKHLGAEVTVARIRNPAYLEGERVRYHDLLGIDLVISPEIVTALKMVDVILTPGAVEVESFANDRIQLLQFPINDSCPILGKELREFEIPEGYLLLAIERKGSLLIPRGDDALEVGDRAWMACIPAMKGEASAVLGIGQQIPRRVAILGGGRIPLVVARELAKADVQVTLFEKDYDRCLVLSAELPSAHIIHGDGTDVDLLREEGVPGSDHFLAATWKDAVNIVTALMAKQMKVGSATVLVERHTFAETVGAMGIDSVISPRILTANAILKYLRRGEIVSVARIGEDKGEILEFVVRSGSRVAGKSLAEARIPKGAIVGAILKEDGTVRIPRGADVLGEGDHVILFALPNVIAEVEKRFA